MGHHGLPDAHGGADHGDLLQSSVDDQRHSVLPNRPDPSRDERARRRGLCRASRRGQQGSPIFRLDSSKQEAAAETPAARSPRPMPRWWSRGPISLPPRQDPGGQERLSAGGGRTGDQAGDLPSQPGRRRRPGDRETRGCRARAPRHDRCRYRRQAGSRGTDLHAPAGREGERRSRTGSGRGGSRKDRHSRRRERAGGAVHAAGGRHRQPVHASGRGPDPEGAGRGVCRPASGRSRRR